MGPTLVLCCAVLYLGGMRTPHRLHASVTAKQLEALKNESYVTGASIAEVVRRAIDEYLSYRTEYKDRHAGNPCLGGQGVTLK